MCNVIVTPRAASDQIRIHTDAQARTGTKQCRKAKSVTPGSRYMYMRMVSVGRREPVIAEQQEKSGNQAPCRICVRAPRIYPSQSAGTTPAGCCMDLRDGRMHARTKAH